MAAEEPTGGNRTKVHRDAGALMFAARRPALEALIARQEIPLTFGFTRQAGVTPQPLVTRPALSPVRACDWDKRRGDVLLERGEESEAAEAYAAAARTPGCLDAVARDAAAIARGDLALKNGDPAAAAAAYAGLSDPRVRANRGLALMSLGRAREAEAELSAALAADPHQPEARLAGAFALEALGRRRRCNRLLSPVPRARPAPRRGRARPRGDRASRAVKVPAAVSNLQRLAQRPPRRRRAPCLARTLL